MHMMCTLVVRGPDRTTLERRTKPLRQRVKDLGAEVRLLRWEQRTGWLGVAPLRRPRRLHRGQPVETGTVALTYPFSAGTLAIEGGVPFGVAASTGVTCSTAAPRNKNRHMCWDGTSGAGKGYSLRVLLSRQRFANGLRVYGIDPDEQQEYAGRFCHYLAGSRVPIRTVLEAEEFSFADVANPDVLSTSRTNATAALYRTGPRRGKKGSGSTASATSAAESRIAGPRGLGRALGVLLDSVAMRGSLRSCAEALRLEDVLDARVGSVQPRRRRLRSRHAQGRELGNAWHGAAGAAIVAAVNNWAVGAAPGRRGGRAGQCGTEFARAGGTGARGRLGGRSGHTRPERFGSSRPRAPAPGPAGHGRAVGVSSGFAPGRGTHASAVRQGLGQ
jgi:hypothetical protein